LISEIAEEEEGNEVNETIRMKTKKFNRELLKLNHSSIDANYD
jgi:hypothetical protein